MEASCKSTKLGQRDPNHHLCRHFHSLSFWKGTLKAMHFQPIYYMTSEQKEKWVVQHPNQQLRYCVNRGRFKVKKNPKILWTSYMDGAPPSQYTLRERQTAMGWVDQRSCRKLRWNWNEVNFFHSSLPPTRKGQSHEQKGTENSFMIRFISGDKVNFLSHNFISVTGGSSAAASISYNQNSNRVRTNGVGGGGRDDGFHCHSYFIRAFTHDFIWANQRYYTHISAKFCLSCCINPTSMSPLLATQVSHNLSSGAARSSKEIRFMHPLRNYFALLSSI